MNLDSDEEEMLKYYEGVFIWTAHVFVKRFQLKRPSGNLSRVLMNEGGLYYLSSAGTTCRTSCVATCVADLHPSLAVALILAVITRPNSRVSASIFAKGRLLHLY